MRGKKQPFWLREKQQTKGLRTGISSLVRNPT